MSSHLQIDIGASCTGSRPVIFIFIFIFIVPLAAINDTNTNPAVTGVYNE